MPGNSLFQYINIEFNVIPSPQHQQWLPSQTTYLLRWLLGLLLVSHTGVGQDAYQFCQPDIINYTRQQYGAHKHNWSIAQSPRTRFMYLANSRGLLEYDGSTWRVYELPKKQRVRSVAVDETGRIFTGALGEFGYWAPGPSGELTYKSLAPLIRDPAFRNEEIWHVLVTPRGILFQSFAYMFRYWQGRVEAIPTPGNVLFVRAVRNRLLVEVIDKGLYELRGKTFTLIPGSEFLGRETVNTLLPLGKTELLVGTERALYRYDGRRFRPFNAQLNAFIQQNRLNRGIQLGADGYAFGTLLNGVLITTSDGRIRYLFNQQTGLQNNTVLALWQDANRDLWVGMDQGADLIHLSSPIRYFTDSDGDLGTFFDLARHQGNLYLGTNQGVYYKPLAQPELPFRLITGTQGQVWQLSVQDGQLLCGHNRGTFLIDGTTARLLCPITGGWALRRLAKHPDRLLQATYTKLCVYQKDKRGQWVFAHTVDGFSAPVRQLEEDETGAIWLNKAPSQGIQRLYLSPDLKRVVKSTSYDSPAFQTTTANLAQLAGRIVVTAAPIAQVFDPTRQQFSPAPLRFPFLKPGVQKLFQLAGSELLLLHQDGRLQHVQAGQTTAHDIPVRTNRWVEEDETLVDLDTNYLGLCRENGFALIPRRGLSQLQQTATPPPLIRSVTTLDTPAVQHTFQAPQRPDAALSFSHKQANLLVTFCTPAFTQPVQYSYWLENNMSSWSPYQPIQQKEFNNLPAGQYVLHLRANGSPTESTLAFEIRPPWYWSVWSKLGYLLLGVGALTLSYRLHLRRVATKQQQLRTELEARLRQQEEASQREIILLQKEQLEQGLIQKSEELANSTMTLIRKNELLMQLKDELNQVRNQVNGRGTGEHFQHINRLIDQNISSEQDWALFEANFNKVHEQFLKRLIDQYPDLGQGDMKLAAYLRMNLSTKEIAQLLNITPRSVELKRYRLRKKLNLDAQANLSEFMIKY
ncbi:hypothetical protein [Fibrella aestuarina]|uniref:hypothetical protein n=1 Tax=Fibrella aestuarina TaxID=651143 RepID=UPI00031188D5|nr:hypothetical protein [Fibrella aestuarina]